MAKTSSRKHATRKKARARHAGKTRARRPSGARPSTSRVAAAVEIVPEAEIVDDESSLRREPELSGQDFDEEAGIYGAGRGESAGDPDEATG